MGWRSTYRSGNETFNSEYNTFMYRLTTTDLGYYNPYMYTNNISSGSSYRSIMPIRFLVLDKDFKVLNDSVVTNKKGATILSANRYANLMMGNRSCLILKQDLPRKRRGLLLVSVDSSNKILTSDITVFEKYEYLLQNAQTIRNETLLMPYVQGSQVGLVKLSFANVER